MVCSMRELELHADFFFGGENLNAEHLYDLGIDAWIILRWILKNS
jgi:hypothetical protein